MNTCHVCNKKDLKRLDQHLRTAHPVTFKRMAQDVKEPPKQKGDGSDSVAKKQKYETEFKNFREARYVTVQPRNLQKDGSNLLFIYNGSDQWVDLAATKLKLQLKIVKKDGTTLPANPTVYPIQALHSTLWDRVTVDFNNKLIDYPSQPQYINYLNLLLGTSQETKSTTLKSIGYMSVVERKAMIKNSKTVNFYGPLMSDVFQQKKFLPPHTDMRINLNAADPKFVLTNTDGDAADYKFEIVDVEIHFKLLEPDEISVIKKDVTIPIGRRLITMNSILKGQQHFTRQDLTSGRDLPKRVFVTFVASSAFLGDKTQDPFEMKKHNIKNISLTKSGVDVMGMPYFPDDSMVREYTALREVMGMNGITLKEFDTVSTVFAFQVNGVQNETNKNGHTEGDLSLNVEFNAATTSNLEMIVMCEYDEKVIITPSKEVMVQ